MVQPAAGSYVCYNMSLGVTCLFLMCRADVMHAPALLKVSGLGMLACEHRSHGHRIKSCHTYIKLCFHTYNFGKVPGARFDVNPMLYDHQ